MVLVFLAFPSVGKLEVHNKKNTWYHVIYVIFDGFGNLRGISGGSSGAGIPGISIWGIGGGAE